MNPFRRPGCICAFVAVLLVAFGSTAWGAPIPYEGDQHAGINFHADFTPPPVEVIVQNLTTDITPASTVPGVHVWSQGPDGTSYDWGGTSFFGDGPDGGWGATGLHLTVDFLGDPRQISTDGAAAPGIMVDSVGGKGGDGGGATGLLGVGPAFGGHGGGGGNGGPLAITSDGAITTNGQYAHGVFAESRGNRGGHGGWAFSTTYAEGGDGGGGGAGGLVEVESSGSITIHSNEAHGILAQSLGGSGGSGGEGDGIFGAGGAGKGSGTGGKVSVTSTGIIQTQGTDSRGIFAQSVGGFAGAGGGAGALFAWGGSGNSGGAGGVVEVTNDGAITTAGAFPDASGAFCDAILAQSVGGGGGDGGSSGGLVTFGGEGEAGGHGGAVTVVNNARLETSGADSSGIFAQSLGGGGGSGGGSVAAGIGFAVSIGGAAGPGGHGGGSTGEKKVYVDSRNGSISTEGDRSHGVLAQSVGGGGGKAGFAVSGALGAVNIGIGGAGGSGGNGGIVEVDTGGTITTSGGDAHGIFAQSVGGGGGSGGFSVAGGLGGMGLGLAMGGKGGAGGSGDEVTVGTASPIQSEIATSGDRAYGILAQSVGGGGGDGGFSVTGAVVSGPAVNLAMGGSGGLGGAGGVVNVTSAGSITTERSEAHAIFAQSVGGGGGSGGFSVAGEYGGATSLTFAFGADGGGGGFASAVNVGTQLAPIQGGITTSGDRAYGILAQSVGGGGGDGGFSITGRLLGGTNSNFSFGGTGGVGSIGGAVNVYSAGSIATGGDRGHGILAQSVGGGGGSGGWSLNADVTAFGGFGLSMGGDGGIGNSGGTVDVDNSGTIETEAGFSHGIVAQSVGGGGGSGGASGLAMVNFSSLIPIPAPYPSGSLEIGITLGGKGAQGGVGGSVNVTNTGQITTGEGHSYGILAQSIGGGGGDGGRSIAATGNVANPIPGDPSEPQLEVQVDFVLAIGGSAGAGNVGGTVVVGNEGGIDTSGDGSHGVFAQSVGGGGGAGGNARALTVSIDLANLTPEEFSEILSTVTSPLSFSKAVNISIGGNGADGGHGGTVTVQNTGTAGGSIITCGADAHGIFAQSIGGGGGAGGGGFHGLDWEDLGVPADFVPIFEQTPLLQTIKSVEDATVVVGGTGGSSGHGDVVHVGNARDITTEGDGSFGILAQSIGGGGGTGGMGAMGTGTVNIGGAGGGGDASNGGPVSVSHSGQINTQGVAAPGIFAQSVGGGGGIAGNVDQGVASTDLGLNVAFGRGGGSGGDGGTVTVTSTGGIATGGSGASGIFAQSVGGGGGLAGQLDVGLGISFAGSVGGAGSAGAVNVSHTGSITTLGDVSHGIVAQSAGGQGSGGAVAVTLDGGITAQGAGSDGILVQSRGDSGNGNVSVTVTGGTVQGGTGAGAGVRFLNGAANTLTNHGTVTAAGGAAGNAVIGTSGNETIDNYGVVTGTVDLGAGANAFHNNAGATFNCGPVVSLGAGNWLTNDGTLSPGGPGAVLTTTLTSNLVQTGPGTYSVDLDVQSGAPDRLNLDETADVDGLADISIVNPGWAVPGTRQATILSAAGGVTNSGLSLAFQPSAVIDYELLFPNPTDVDLKTTIDFAPAGLTANQQAVGDCVNRIQLAGGSASFAPFAAELFALPDRQSLASAYDQLSPEPHDAFARAAFDVTEQYTQTLVKRMHSIRSYLEKADSTRNTAPQDRQGPAGTGTGASTRPAMKSKVAERAKRRCGTWLEGFGLWGKQGADAGYTAYDYRCYGTAVGMDRLFLDRLLVGFGVGYSNASIHHHGNTSRGDINSVSGSVYGSYFTDRMYLDFALSYGRQCYRNTRHLQIGALSRTAEGRHRGNAYSAYAEGGYNLPLKKCIFQPFASLHYIYLDEEGFTESGAPGVNLHVKRRQTDSLVSQLGLRVSRAFHTPCGDLIPEASVAWRHDFDIDGRVTTAAFDGAPGVAFSTGSQSVARNGVVVGTGITLQNKKGFGISLKYSGDFRDQYRAHWLFLGLRYEF